MDSLFQLSLLAAFIVLKKQVPEIFRRSDYKEKTDVFMDVLSYSWPLI